MRPVLLAAFLLPAAALAQEDPAVGVAPVADPDGTVIGEVRLSAMENGFVNVVVSLEGIPEGVHGVHLHEVGDCSADDFSSAGPHISGDAQHGFDNPEGPHPGDLPNAHVQGDGVLAAQFMTDRIALDDTMIFDADGSALIIHSNSDDYRTDPGGNAGDRIACGEIVRAVDE